MRSDRGMALVSALLLMAVMSALALALTTSGRIEVALGDNEELYHGARVAAESGLNHAAVVILAQATGAGYTSAMLLRGPDGGINANTVNASVNADNGDISHLMTGAAPWPVAPGSAYSYDVHVFDDDDPAVKGGVAFTADELSAMGGENGNRFTDVNGRLVIRATGSGPRGATAVLEQVLSPVPAPALLVNGNLTISGNPRVTGGQGSLHANGNLILNGNVTVDHDATASGTLTSNGNVSVGGIRSGGMPAIPVPNIRADDYRGEADFILQSDGRITNLAETTTYCNAGSNQNACRNVRPSGGTANFGWTFRASSGWTLSQNNANAGTYFAETDVTISGNPGSSGAPIRLTLIAQGDISISGNPDLRPEADSGLQFVTDRDLSISGNLTIPLAFEGRILVREQMSLNGNAQLAGQVMVQNVPSVSTLVTANTISGNVRISSNGGGGSATFTVSGWREIP